jgi:hypothetical protein
MTGDSKECVIPSCRRSLLNGHNPRSTDGRCLQLSDVTDSALSITPSSDQILISTARSIYAIGFVTNSSIQYCIYENRFGYGTSLAVFLI